MESVLVVFGGGVLGAVARFGLGQWIGRWFTGTFPLGTFVINMIGCLVIGILTAQKAGMASMLYLFLAVGFTAAFTTFSTFTYETVRLIEQRQWTEALLNPALSVGIGLLSVMVGYSLGGIS